LVAYLDKERLKVLRRYSKNRYRASEKAMDLYSLLDPRHLEELKRMEAIDSLSLEERDLLSARCGILEYQGLEPLTYNFLAKASKKSLRTIYRIFKRIKDKLRKTY